MPFVSPWQRARGRSREPLGQWSSIFRPSRASAGSLIYLVDRHTGPSIYDIDFVNEPDVPAHPSGVGLKEIDHLTHNVGKGRMDYFYDFYNRVFNFREHQYFDISGEYTGLTSRALSAPCGKIRIPINESKFDEGSSSWTRFRNSFSSTAARESSTWRCARTISWTPGTGCMRTD